MKALEFPLRMKHEYNGFHHANDYGDKERMEKNGWVVEEPPVVETKKRGRPPKAD